MLVVWQLESGTKTFLPRLGAPLRSVACSEGGQWYAVGMANNSVALVNAMTSRVTARLRGMALAAFPASDRCLARGVVVDPRTNTLVLNSAPADGGLQFYDPAGDRQVLALQVSHRNFTSGADQKPPPPVRVLCAAVNGDGSAIVTVSQSSDPMLDTLTLKFWDWVPEAHRFVQNTRVDAPHKTTVSALAWHPTLPVVVSASLDRTFKVWERVARPRAPSMAAVMSSSSSSSGGRGDDAASLSETMWHCRSAGFYRDLPVTDVAFSGDGSVLAVANSHLVTLWSPLSNTLKHTLTHPRPDSPVRRLAFAGDSSYLVAVTDEELYVWNLLTCSVWWAYTAKVRALVVDEFGLSTSGAFFAIAVRDGENTARGKGPSGSGVAGGGDTVLLFDSSSAVPVRCWSLGADATASLAFLPASVAAKGDASSAAGGASPAEDAAGRLFCVTDDNRVAHLATIAHKMTSAAELTMLNGKPETSASGATKGAGAGAGAGAAAASGTGQSAYDRLFGTGSGGSGDTAGAATVRVSLEDVDGSDRKNPEQAFQRLVAGQLHTLPGMGALFDAYADVVFPAAPGSDDSDSDAGAADEDGAGRSAVWLGHGESSSSGESDSDSDSDSDGSAAEVPRGGAAGGAAGGSAVVNIGGELVSRARADEMALEAAMWGLVVCADADADNDDGSGAPARKFGPNVPDRYEAISDADVLRHVDEYDAALAACGAYEVIASAVDGRVGVADLPDMHAGGLRVSPVTTPASALTVAAKPAPKKSSTSKPSPAKRGRAGSAASAGSRRSRAGSAASGDAEMNGGGRGGRK